MLKFAGQLVSRFWPLVLVGWGAVLVGLTLTAPSWDEVADDGEFSFLPADAPSRRGEELFERAFPQDPGGSSIVVVLRRRANRGLTSQDRDFIRDELLPDLERIADDEPAIDSIRSLEDPDVGQLLVSDDGRATLVIVELTSGFQQDSAKPAVSGIERLLAEASPPEGLELALSGSAVIGRDLDRARGESAKSVQSWTIWLVIGILLLVYRAPLLTLIPLVTVYVGVEVTAKVLALLAHAGVVGLFDGLQVYMTVILYGAGVDYTVFLIGRAREELAHSSSAEAIAESVSRVGEAITASAGTTIFGIGMLAFAEFGKLNRAGIAIALGLFIVLCAALTLAPALLRVPGRWAFWPQIPGRESREGRLASLAGKETLQWLWKRVGRAIERRPGTIWLTSVAFMIPFALLAIFAYGNLSYGLVTELRGDAPSVRGTELIQEHFPAGATGTLTVLLRSESVDFARTEGVAAVDRLTDRLEERQKSLHIADVRSVAEPLGLAHQEYVAGQTGGVASLARRRAVRQRSVEHYVGQTDSAEASITRLDIVLSLDPFSREAIHQLDEMEDGIRNALPEELRDARMSLIGSTASLRDLKNVAQRDQRKIEIFVTVAVLAILILMLWKLALSVYLVLTVIFSYLVTLGVTFGFFWLLEGESFVGLDWTVPLLLFTLLVAVGEDYNIFLVTRVREEQERHGPVRGVVEALVRTGAIISTCGIIVAATFSSLAIGGTLDSMIQLGFALTFGILLDTFIVHPVLVPAYLVLVHRGTFGGLSRYLGTTPDIEQEDHPTEEPRSRERETIRDDRGLP